MRCLLIVGWSIAIDIVQGKTISIINHHSLCKKLKLYLRILRNCYILLHMEHSSPALSRALHYLVNQIVNKASVLPAINELARAAQVSERTMWEAARSLRQRGILDTQYGRGLIVRPDAAAKCRQLIDVTAPAEPSGPDEKRAFAWQKTAGMIRRNLLNGTHPPHMPLPSIKELCNIYHISRTTMHKALAQVASQGLLTPAGKTYTPSAPSIATTGKRIVFISLADVERRLMLQGPAESFYKATEEHCLRSNIKLDICGYYYDVNWEETRAIHFVDANRDICDFPQSEAILGYIFLVGTMREAEEYIMRILSHISKPIAVLDLAGGWKAPWYLQRPHVQLFESAISSQAGQDIAGYLHALGHRRVAYISPFHRAAWSRNRLHGLRQAYNLSGYTNAIEPFTADNPPAIHSEYQSRGRQRGRYADLATFYKHWSQHHEPDYHAVLDPLFQLQIPRQILAQAEFRRYVRSLFDNALQQKNSTAWVLANDEVAIAALDYLQEKKIRVPGELSVCSFDDSPVSMRRGLTSYNFNMRAYAHAMQTFIVNRRAMPVRPSRRAIEIEGMVVERVSSGPVRL
ncbi:MAG: GntR family transcriptional regulator [Chitinivibrionales bacterium]|nr:GntR family transcriptional regulator [Chitinivibrionales bacterium]